MSGPAPYMSFPGTAREALSFYEGVFGGSARLHTFGEMGRTDGPTDYIGHGYLADAPVSLFVSDATGDQPAFQAQGLMLALLGTADPPTLRAWFAGLADGGNVIDDLQLRPWGDYDGQVIDRYGLHWLIGFTGDSAS